MGVRLAPYSEAVRKGCDSTLESRAELEFRGVRARGTTQASCLGLCVGTGCDAVVVDKMQGYAEAVSTFYGGTHKRMDNRRLMGAARADMRRRVTFMPGNSEHADFLMHVFQRNSQLPNPTYMLSIDPKDIGTQNEELERLSMVARHSGSSPEVMQVAIYRVMLAGLAEVYTLPSARVSL